MDKEMKIIPPEGYEVDTEHSTFECIKFKLIKPQLPTTWEEFCKLYPAKEGEAYINNAGKVSRFSSRYRDFSTDKNVLPSEECAEAMLALCQLIQLRDCYNQGWQPDWRANNTPKPCIIFRAGVPIMETRFSASQILTFNTKKLCEEFFKNFRDLIETAKPLL